MTDRRLGRGLEGLLKGRPSEPLPDLAAPRGPVTSVAVGLLDPNPHQPRQTMKAEDLEQLQSSIREHGVLQPIVVRHHGERYQVIAGERRYRAAQAVGLAEVSVVVRDVADDQMLELALVENLQRSDLDPIEKAQSFESYLESSGRTQAEAAVRLGLDRSTIANMVRLLDLPAAVQDMVRSGLVAMGHARAILALEDTKKQVHLAERVAREGLSVRQVERMVAPGGPRKSRARASAKGAQVRDIEARLREALGTKVTVDVGPKPGTGRVVIEFYTPDDLDRILARLT